MEKTVKNGGSMRRFLLKNIIFILVLSVMFGTFPAGAISPTDNLDADAYIAELVSEGAKVSFQTTSLERTGKPMTGIDVSEYQGNIDWAKVKNAGVEFAMLRICSHIPDTPNYTVDAKFAQNIAGAKAQGIHLGAYFFSYARNIDDVVNEANMIVNILKDYPATFSFPIVFDAEPGDTKDGFDISSFAGDACATFRRILEENGYFVSIYANTYWFNSVIDPNKIAGADLWQANYFDAYKGYTPSQGYSVASSRPSLANSNDQYVFMWQYTRYGKVDGIWGDVDMNICYKNYSEIIPAGGFNGYAKKHTHEYNTDNSDEASHWKECSCGDKASVEGHLFEKSVSDTHHYEKCSVCNYVNQSTNEEHNFADLKYDNGGHFFACSCGYVLGDLKEPHVHNIQGNDDYLHYMTCVCGHIDMNSIEQHEYSQTYDEYMHYDQCSCKVINLSTLELHEYDIQKYDDTGHWQECKCGYKGIVEEHIFKGRYCEACDYERADEIGSGSDEYLDTEEITDETSSDDIIESPNTDDSLETSKPTDIFVPIDTIAPIDTMAPIETIYPIETTVPIETIAPIETEKPFETTDRLETEVVSDIDEIVGEDTDDSEESDDNTGETTFIGSVVGIVVAGIKGLIYTVLYPLKLVFAIFGI